MTPPDLLRIDDVPVYQNKRYRSRDEALACARGTVALVQDPRTGLVFNRAYDPALLAYDDSYQNEQAHSAAFQRLLEQVAGIVERNLGGRPMLEIGCGKAHFLELLRARGHDAIGVDPAYEGDSPHVFKAHFAADTSMRRDGIVMRHTLEHVPAPLDFLDEIRRGNGGRGLIYIEVPSLDWILAHRAWFDVFYEHVNYFRLHDFHRMFGRVVDAGHVFDGQYLYVVADLASWRGEAMPPGETVRFPSGFFDDIDRSLQGVDRLRQHAVWGAAAKGVMFSHHATRRGFPLAFAIDINPAKQGGFLAGSGLEILAPAQGLARLRHGDGIFVMNSAYLQEIRAQGGDDYGYFAVDRHERV